MAKTKKQESAKTRKKPAAKIAAEETVTAEETSEIDHQQAEEEFTASLESKSANDLRGLLDDVVHGEYTRKGRHIPRTIQVLIALAKK